MKTTWTEFGRAEGETDAEWAAVCKQMAAFLQAQAIEARRAATGNTDAVEDESAVGKADAP